MSSTYWLEAGWRNRLAVLAGPLTVAYGAGDVDIPGSSSRALTLVVELLGPNTSFIFFLLLSPYHRPLLTGPKSHVRPQEKKSAEVLSVREP